MLGGGGTAEQEGSAVAGGGGIAEQDGSAVTGGGGIAEQDGSAISGGGGAWRRSSRASKRGGGRAEVFRDCTTRVVQRPLAAVLRGRLRPGRLLRRITKPNMASHNADRLLGDSARHFTFLFNRRPRAV